jgi:uncharacterized membrane protein YciS (DUF1049 family)
MRMIKWFLFFGIAFAFSWVLIFTFMQEPFRAMVTAKVLWYQSKPYPIYYFVLGSFTIGLLVGIVLLLYNFIFLNVQLHRANKRIRELEEQTSLTPSVAPIASESTPSAAINGTDFPPAM